MPPLIPPFGRVSLGPTGAETTFTTDPEPYEPYRWEKRQSEVQVLNGGVVHQDFGVFAKDRRLLLRHETLDDTVVQAIDGYYRTRGSVFHFTDWLGNDFTVFIADFTHTPHGRLLVSGYQLQLLVTGITTLFGAAYAGT